jgi:hypothetical protein
MWSKAAAAAFVMLTGIAGWGLKKVYDVDIRVTRIDAKLEIWMTPERAEYDEASYGIVLAGYSPQQSAEFARKAMVRAANQLLVKDTDGALKTLLIGLDETGLRCSPVGDHLECK